MRKGVLEVDYSEDERFYMELLGELRTTSDPILNIHGIYLNDVTTSDTRMSHVKVVLTELNEFLRAIRDGPNKSRFLFKSGDVGIINEENKNGDVTVVSGTQCIVCERRAEKHHGIALREKIFVHNKCAEDFIEAVYSHLEKEGLDKHLI